MIFAKIRVYTYLLIKFIKLGHKHEVIQLVFNLNIYICCIKLTLSMLER